MSHFAVLSPRQIPRSRSYSSRNSSATFKRFDGGSQGPSLDALDLPVPVSHQLAELLDVSIAEAMLRLQSFKVEVVDYCSEGGDDEEEDAETTLTETDHESSAGIASHLPRAPYKRMPQIDGTFRAKRDAKMLQDFLQEGYSLLATIRNDVQSHLPSFPSAQELQQRFPSASATVAAVDPRAVIDSLANSYQRANEVLSRLALFSASSLPELPDIFASLPFSSARASIVEYSGGRRDYLSPHNELSLKDCNIAKPSQSPSTPIIEPLALPAIKPLIFDTASTEELSETLLSAMRAFLANRSAKLQAKLPSRPPLQEWAGSLSDKMRDAKDFVQDEGEKVVDFVVDEADKVKTALMHGADRLLQYHELPHEWKNNPVGRFIS